MPASQRHSSPSDEREGPARKRVGKACDRCRLKKSKCNGLSPCSRCTVDNAICVFGERRRVQDRVYPKGYVEMLEQQQAQLVAGIRELYHRLQPHSSTTGWPGKPLDLEPNGHPLTHSILERLDLLYLRIEGGPIPDGRFEEDPEVLRREMLSSQNGSDGHNRLGSVCSTPPDSDDFPHSRGNSFSHSHSNSFDFPALVGSQRPIVDFGTPVDVKPEPVKAKPGRPRQNKAGVRAHHPYRRPGGDQPRTRRSNASVSSIGSIDDAKPVVPQQQQQQQLSNGFQVSMEQFPQATSASYHQFPASSLSAATSGVPVVVSIPSTSTVFRTELLSSPDSPAGMAPLVSSSQAANFASLPTSGPSPTYLNGNGVSSGAYPVSTAAVPSAATTVSASTTSFPSSAAFANSQQHHHHHGDSVSSIGTIDSAMAGADHMFDLGNASLDDTVSLFDPFVAGDGAMAGDDDRDPLRALGSFVSDQVRGNPVSVGSSGIAVSASAPTAGLVAGVGSAIAGGPAMLSPCLADQSFDFLTLRQNGIMS